MKRLFGIEQRIRNLENSVNEISNSIKEISKHVNELRDVGKSEQLVEGNKHKHMDYIQSTISRLTSNSFYLKGWSITVVTAIVALSIKEGEKGIYICALILTFAFWCLDAYYLRQEKLYRELYDKVSKTDGKNIDFSMNVSEYKGKVQNIPCIMIWNISVTPLYLSISIVLIILIHVV